MTYHPHHYAGPLRILDGHPVPYSLTCQRARKDSGEIESVPAVHFLSEINDWLSRHRPGQALTRCDGCYAMYSPKKVEKVLAQAAWAA